MPLARTNTGIVDRVTCADGSQAVLKCLSRFGRLHEGTSPAVLRAFDGQGAVRVLRADPGAHLIEYCAGPKVRDVPDGASDEFAIPALADVVARLHSHAPARPDSVESLAQRCQALDRGLEAADTRARSMMLKARRMADELLADQEPRLLHGDLHHENVLRCDRPGGSTWLAIDPQGVWGDPAYEVANLFGNPRDVPEITLAPNRPARLAWTLSALLGHCPNRMLRWAFVHSCISAAWSIEDAEDPTYRLRVAALIDAELAT